MNPLIRRFGVRLSAARSSTAAQAPDDVPALVRAVLLPNCKSGQRGCRVDFMWASLPDSAADPAAAQHVFRKCCPPPSVHAREGRPAVAESSSASGEKVYSVRDNGAGLYMQHPRSSSELSERFHSTELRSSRRRPSHLTSGRAAATVISLGRMRGRQGATIISVS